MDKATVDIVIAHSPCRDGLCAAFIVKQAFPKAEYIPANYGQKPPDVRGKHVVIVDFSYPRDVLLQMKEAAASLMVLDHHRTAEENLRGLDFCIFDMSRSGAKLAYDYFGQYKHRELVNYIQDRDLWQWKMPAVKEISAVIDSYPLTFESLESLSSQICYKYDEMVDEGAGILRYQDKLVDQLCESKRLVRWPAGSGTTAMDFHEVFAVNTAVLQSEVANKISEGKAFGVAWYQNQEGLFCYSLRNKEDNPFDTTFVKTLGGGGHLHASGLRSKEKLI